MTPQWSRPLDPRNPMKPLRGGKKIYNGVSTTPQTVDGWDRHLVLSVCGTHTYWTLSGTSRLTDYVHFGSRQKSKSVSSFVPPSTTLLLDDYLGERYLS